MDYPSKDPHTVDTKESSDVEKAPGGGCGDEQTPYTGIVDEKEYGHVRRGLKSRHVQFIAIGGIIGTGLFVGSGSALLRAGPLSILLAYAIVGTVIYSLMLAIGEVGMVQLIYDWTATLMFYVDDNMATNSRRIDHICAPLYGSFVGVCDGMELHDWRLFNW